MNVQHDRIKLEKVHLSIQFPGCLGTASAEGELVVTAALREPDSSTLVEPRCLQPITVALDSAALELRCDWRTQDTLHGIMGDLWLVWYWNC